MVNDSAQSSILIGRVRGHAVETLKRGAVVLAGMLNSWKATVRASIDHYPSSLKMQGNKLTCNPEKIELHNEDF